MVAEMCSLQAFWVVFVLVGVSVRLFSIDPIFHAAKQSSRPLAANDGPALQQEPLALGQDWTRRRAAPEQSCIYIYRQTDTQTDTDRQTDIQTDRQTV